MTGKGVGWGGMGVDRSVGFGGGCGFFLAYKDVGRMFDHSFAACDFLLLLLLLF